MEEVREEDDDNDGDGDDDAPQVQENGLTTSIHFANRYFLVSSVYLVNYGLTMPQAGSGCIMIHSTVMLQYKYFHL